MNSSDIKKQNMIRALNNSLGIVTSACKAVGIHRSTHYEWMKSDPDYQREVEDIEEVAIDFVEGQLHELIKGARAQSPKGFYYQLPPNLKAVMFYLKTKGRKRGYAEKPEKEQDAVKKISKEEAEELRVKKIMESPETQEFLKNWGPPEEYAIIPGLKETQSSHSDGSPPAGPSQ